MKTQTEEIEAAQRRGARIAAMNAGKPIPFPESAVSDARPGSVDDERVLALLRGRNQIAGADCFPPAQMMADNKRSTIPQGAVAWAANETPRGMLAVGPKVRSNYGIFFDL